MILFLFGQDKYRSRLKLKEIIEHYKKIHKSGLNLAIFDLKEKSFEEFINFFESSSMFNEKKLAILENVSQNEDFQKKFLKRISYFSNSKNFVLFYEGEIKENNFFKELKKNSRWQNFQLLEGKKLEIWVKREVKNLGAEIDQRALKKLIEFVGNDLWRMENEIKKLVSFSGGKKIELEDVKTLVAPEIESDIFKMIDAIGQKNKILALKLIHRHLEKGESPFYLLSMINYQLRNILLIKDSMEKNRPLKELELSPFLIQKTISQARKFSFSEIKKIYRKVFEVDLKIKTGQIKPELALDLLVSEI
jgi:DNA polymerase-3 subunit delta